MRVRLKVRRSKEGGGRFGLLAAAAQTIELLGNGKNQIIRTTDRRV